MGKKNNNKQQKSLNRSESSSFSVVLFYCLLIIFFPITTFFSLKHLLFDNYFELTSVQSNIYAAISAVIALHIALGLYLYRAYFEYDPAAVKPMRSEKQD